MGRRWPARYPVLVPSKPTAGKHTLKLDRWSGSLQMTQSPALHVISLTIPMWSWPVRISGGLLMHSCHVRYKRSCRRAESTASARTSCSCPYASREQLRLRTRQGGPTLPVNASGQCGDDTLSVPLRGDLRPPSPGLTSANCQATTVSPVCILPPLKT